MRVLQSQYTKLKQAADSNIGSDTTTDTEQPETFKRDYIESRKYTEFDTEETKPFERDDTGRERCTKIDTEETKATAEDVILNELFKIVGVVEEEEPEEEEPKEEKDIIWPKLRKVLSENLMKAKHYYERYQFDEGENYTKKVTQVAHSKKIEFVFTPKFSRLRKQACVSTRKQELIAAEKEYNISKGTPGFDDDVDFLNPDGRLESVAPAVYERAEYLQGLEFSIAQEIKMADTLKCTQM